MQLPFTVVIESPSLVRLRRPIRFGWRCAVAVGIIASGLSWLAVSRPETQQGTEAVGTVLLVNSSPAAAVVEVDGRARGQTPVGVPIVPGEHRVTLRRDEYADAAYVINAQPGQAVNIEADLWLRSPRVQRLRPAYPGVGIVAADFLRDGRVALTMALPPDNEQQLWIVEGSGMVRRARPRDVRGRLSVAPDGERVAYLSPGQSSSAVDGRPNEVWISSRDGEPGKRFYALPADARSERPLDLSWSPDGQHLLLASHQQLPGGGQRTRLRILDAASGDAWELANLPSDIVPGSYVWSPTGDWVAFLTRAGQLTSLCLVGTDGNFRYLADLGEDDSDPLPIPPLAWSADGRQVLYAAPTQDRPAAGVWLPGSRPTSALFTAELAQPVGQRLGSTEGESPTWRRDGSIVALARSADRGSLKLRLVDPAGETRDIAELPLKAGSALAARWDPDHAQAIVALRRSTNLGMGQPEYWLVRFRPEAN